MTQASIRFWRCEFKTDLTRSNAGMIPLAHMIEARWKRPAARGLAMFFRPELNPPELEKVNLKTWSELQHAGDFLSQLFDRAWEDLDATLRAYPVRSALRLIEQSVEAELKGFDPATSAQELLSVIACYNGDLSPQIAGQKIELRPAAGRRALPKQQQGARRAA